MLRFVLRNGTSWAPAGHEVASSQFPIRVDSTTRRSAGNSAAIWALQVRDESTTLVLNSPRFVLKFDKVRAMITQWAYAGQDLFLAGPKLNFFRASTDNDRGRNSMAEQWKASGLHWLQHRVDSVEVSQISRDTAQVKARVRIAPPVHRDRAFECFYTWSVRSNGAIALRVQGTPVGPWPAELPRIGLIASLPSRLNQIAWFGRGPGESYPDTCSATYVDRFTSTADGLRTNYLFPQENGNRSDCRWVQCTDVRGNGIAVIGELFNFNLSRNTPWEIDAARHPFELKPRADLTLTIDRRVNGIGSASCGPGVLQPYRCEPLPFDINLQWFPVQDGSPIAH